MIKIMVVILLINSNYQTLSKNSSYENASFLQIVGQGFQEGISYFLCKLKRYSIIKVCLNINYIVAFKNNKSNTSNR